MPSSDCPRCGSDMIVPYFLWQGGLPHRCMLCNTIFIPTEKGIEMSTINLMKKGDGESLQKEMDTLVKAYHDVRVKYNDTVKKSCGDYNGDARGKVNEAAINLADLILEMAQISIYQDEDIVIGVKV